MSVSAGRRLLGLVAAGAVAAATLGLAGCAQADTAAIVGGQRISEEQAQLATTQINEAFKETLSAPLTTSQVLSQLIAASFVNDVAAAAGVGTTESAARTAMPNLSDPTKETLALVQSNFALQQLDQAQQTEVLTRLKNATVTVNPRYGRFDPATVAFTEGRPNWIKASR